MYHGIERNQGDAHVGRVRGDAVLASAEDGVHAGPAIQRRASRAWVPLVAGGREIPVVGAARSLQNISTDGGYVAQLGRRAREQSLRKHWELSLDFGVMRDVRVGGERADARASAGHL